MGADIHLVIEVSGDEVFQNPRGICFTEWPRQTPLFQAMAGIWGADCPISARGFPRIPSFMAAAHYGLVVCEADELEEVADQAAILKDEAEECLADGTSHRLPPPFQDRVSHPAYSYASWLTLEELRQVIAFSGVASTSLECEVTLEVLERLEGKGYFCRAVFWFDL